MMNGDGWTTPSSVSAKMGLGLLDRGLKPNVSKIERQDDLHFSTIKRYVESLGGEVRLLAVFPDEEVEVRLDRAEVRSRAEARTALP